MTRLSISRNNLQHHDDSLAQYGHLRQSGVIVAENRDSQQFFSAARMYCPIGNATAYEAVYLS
jgi:hypothetical protein